MTFWTDARIETLTTMWGEGKSATEIASHFGKVSRNSILGKIHRLRLNGGSDGPQRRGMSMGGRPSAWTSELIVRAIELRDKGLTSKEIAAEMACHLTPVLIERKLRNVGRPLGHKRRPAYRPAHRKPPAAPPPPPEEVRNVSLMDLQADDCRWPMDGEGEHAKFCGLHKADGSSYCEFHRFLGTSREQPRKRERRFRMGVIAGLVPARVYEGREA